MHWIFPLLPWQQARSTVLAGRPRSVGQVFMSVRTRTVPRRHRSDGETSARAGGTSPRQRRRKSVAPAGDHHPPRGALMLVSPGCMAGASPRASARGGFPESQRSRRRCAPRARAARATFPASRRGFRGSDGRGRSAGSARSGRSGSDARWVECAWTRCPHDRWGRRCCRGRDTSRRTSRLEAGSRRFSSSRFLCDDAEVTCNDHAAALPSEHPRLDGDQGLISSPGTGSARPRKCQAAMSPSPSPGKRTYRGGLPRLETPPSSGRSAGSGKGTAAVRLCMGDGAPAISGPRARTNAPPGYVQPSCVRAIPNGREAGSSK